MENRYNIDLVEKFRKGEIILEFPVANATKQDIDDLCEITQQFYMGHYPYYSNNKFPNSENKFSHYVNVSEKTVKLRDFINQPVDVVVNTKDSLEKIVADNLVDTISMIESFNYEVRKLAEGEIRRGANVWVKFATNPAEWIRCEYIAYEDRCPVSHVVLLNGSNIKLAIEATTTDPNSVKQIKRSDIMDKFDCSNFEIID